MLFAYIDESGDTGEISRVSTLAGEPLGAVGGRLKSDFRIAPDLVYNTFPLPELSEKSKSALTEAAQLIFDVRASFPDATLADLYDSVAMPATLVHAHDDLDKVVDSVFSPRKKFVTEADRLSALFERYDTLTSPLFATGSTKRKRYSART